MNATQWNNAVGRSAVSPRCQRLIVPNDTGFAASKVGTDPYIDDGTVCLGMFFPTAGTVTVIEIDGKEITQAVPAGYYWPTPVIAVKNDGSPPSDIIGYF